MSCFITNLTKWLHIFRLINNNLPIIRSIDEKIISNGKQILVDELEDMKACLEIFDKKQDVALDSKDFQSRFVVFSLFTSIFSAGSTKMSD